MFVTLSGREIIILLTAMCFSTIIGKVEKDKKSTDLPYYKEYVEVNYVAIKDNYI